MEEKKLSLDFLNEGETAIVTDIVSEGTMKRRLQDLGLIRGTEVECIAQSAFRDICVYLIRGAFIAIRNDDADDIFIE